MLPTLSPYSKLLLSVGLALALGCSSEAAVTDAGTAALREAKQRLALAEATAARIARERVVLARDARLDPEIIADLEAYEKSVGDMTDRQRLVVKTLEEKFAPATVAGSANPAPSLPVAYSVPKTAHERLSDEFADSLAAFDEFLLVELEQVEEAPTDTNDQRLTELARQAAAAAKRLEERGIDLNTASGQENPGQDEQADPIAENLPDAPETPAAQPQKPIATEQNPTPGPPPGTPSPHDDDIVARQLREAAERETDPALREKLWREYRDYKEGKQDQ